MFDVIIVANGISSRAGINKLTAKLGTQTVLAKTVSAFSHEKISKIIVVSDDENAIFSNAIRVNGGKTRSESVKNGLKYCSSQYVLIHDGARPFVSLNLIEKVMENTVKHGSCIPYIPVSDSMREINNGKYEYVDRSKYALLQTPQGFIRDQITNVYDSADIVSYDDSELFAKIYGQPYFIEGEIKNKKITAYEDVFGYNVRVGTGFDVHVFGGDNPLVLGGIVIPNHVGLIAHSDGDVVIHAIMDALLNSANLPDIGVLFPDTDEKYKNANSVGLLLEVKKRIEKCNVNINNISVTIMAQTPRLASVIPKMQERIAEILTLTTDRVSINATTTEKMGIVGEKKAIAVLCTVSVF